jgi:Lrp/AsnC family transcriptional regulator, regulator for asnA, asnC and gidA
MEENLHLDSLDKKILSLIKSDARTPFLEVARKCGISGAAVHQRVQRLTKLGIITGSELILDPEKMGYSTCAYVGIFLEKASLYRDVVEELKNIPEIIQCNYTTGNYSLLIKLYTKNNKSLKDILVNKLQSIRGITRTETFISLEEGINRQLPVD